MEHGVHTSGIDDAVPIDGDLLELASPCRSQYGCARHC